MGLVIDGWLFGLFFEESEIKWVYFLNLLCFLICLIIFLNVGILIIINFIFGYNVLSVF